MHAQESNYKKASEVIKNSHRLTDFNGAGITVESGISLLKGAYGLIEKEFGHLIVASLMYNPVLPG